MSICSEFMMHANFLTYFSRLDLTFFAVTLLFICTTLTLPECFSAGCPTGIRTWIIGSFTSFYILQAMLFGLYGVIGRATNSQRRKAYGCSILTIVSLVWVPAMLAWNVWGTVLVEQMMEGEPGQCVYVGFAQSFQLLFLISTYCLIFIYGIFLVVVRECMKRYYIAIEMNPTILRTSLSPPSDF